MDLASARERVVELRRLLALATNEAISLKEALAGDATYQRLIEVENQRNRLRQELSEAEEALRAAAVDEFIRTGNKHPTDGVEVHIKREVRIIDERALVDWAYHNARAALTVKLDVIESALKIGVDVDGAILIEVPRARISRNL